jgi:GntR family transcriptional repressor for pyruvate dehydrogenase complex
VPRVPERPNRDFRPAVVGASEQIALQLRRYLEQQGLQPGDRIGTEAELAEEFGVSRPTLREGLRLLSSSHLIRVGRGRAGGIFVARTPNEGMGRNLSESIALMLAADATSMEELLDGRMFLEVPLAGRAAVNADESVFERLEAAIVDAEGHQPGTEPFSVADARFHRVLAEAAGNDLLLAFTGWILEVLQPTLVAQLSVAIRGEAILDQHRAIARAVRRGQRGAAERAMAAHIQYLVDALAALTEKTPRP